VLEKQTSIPFWDLLIVAELGKRPLPDLKYGTCMSARIRTDLLLLEIRKNGQHHRCNMLHMLFSRPPASFHHLLQVTALHQLLCILAAVCYRCIYILRLKCTDKIADMQLLLSMKTLQKSLY